MNCNASRVNVNDQALLDRRTAMIGYRRLVCRSRTFDFLKELQDLYRLISRYFARNDVVACEVRREPSDKPQHEPWRLCRDPAIKYLPVFEGRSRHHGLPVNSPPAIREPAGHYDRQPTSDVYVTLGIWPRNTSCLFLTLQ
jgi:hypothetical protein